MYGNYISMHWGFHSEGMRALTAYPTVHFPSRFRGTTMSDMLTLVDQGVCGRSFFCGISFSADPRHKINFPKGRHAYSLLGTEVITEKNGTQVKLYKVHNPWGKEKYDGPWHDKDLAWFDVDDQEKTRIGYRNTTEDGFFFHGRWYCGKIR